MPRVSEYPRCAVYDAAASFYRRAGRDPGVVCTRQALEHAQAAMAYSFDGKCKRARKEYRKALRGCRPADVRMDVLRRVGMGPRWRVGRK